MHEEQLVGLAYLEAVTDLQQRVRSAHPTAGVFEAADFQWWWRKERSTDTHPQLLWFDDTGRPSAAVIATDWGDTIGLDPIVLPDATPDWIGHVVERGLAHADDSGLAHLDVAVERNNETLAEAIRGLGLTSVRDEGVDSWMDAAERPEVTELHPDYRLATRLETASTPHHMIERGGPDVERRLRQTSLYRPGLDLVVLCDEDVAGYAMFWLDHVTSTGLVEPMRTEDAHQRRGIARHLLTAGIERLAAAGAGRIKIAWDPGNPGANRLYPSVGFAAARECLVLSRPA